MKRTFISLVLMTFCLAISAQTIDGNTLSYSVRYEKEHLLLQKDSGINVVDYDIEWPEVVDFNKVETLKQTITESIEGVSSTDLDSTLDIIRTKYGKPVTQQFKTIPDDRRFCYITYKADIAGYKRGNWIAYYIEKKVEPQQLSEFKAEDKSRVVVYDLARNRLILANELISSSVSTLMESQDFYDHLFAPLSDDFYNNMIACSIDGVWMDGQDICFLVTAVTAERRITFTARLPYEEYSHALSREGKRVFTKEARPGKPQTIMAKVTWNGDTIYNKVEKMPEFKGGRDGLREYLSHITPPDVQLGRTAKVTVSLVIGKDGSINDVNVITPVSPVIDRHAATVIKGMPKFTPGEQGGKTVCVRLYMPITYR